MAKTVFDKILDTTTGGPKSFDCTEKRVQSLHHSMLEV